MTIGNKMLTNLQLYIRADKKGKLWPGRNIRKLT